MSRILYDYECECGNRFEELVNFDTRDDVTCQKCGHHASRRVTGLKEKNYTWLWWGKRPEKLSFDPENQRTNCRAAYNGKEY